jgi:hypothetical protein
LCVHAAVEDDVRLGGLDGGQNGVEVGSGVGGEFTFHHFQTLGLDGFFKLVSQTLTVSGTVVNDGTFLAFRPSAAN